MLGDKLDILSINISADIKDLQHSLKDAEEAAKDQELQLQALKNLGVSTQDSCAGLTDRFTLLEQVQQTVRGSIGGLSQDPYLIP